MKNKREILARVFGRLGLVGLLERVAAAARPGLIVLTYHRIAEPGADPFYDPVISATAESFRSEIEWLRRHVRVLALPEVVSMMESGSRQSEPCALVTFDDGYRDNFELAAPILSELNVPATFFLPTAFLESPRLPWWDEVAYVIKRTRASRLVLARDPEGRQPALSIDLGEMPRSLAIMTIIRVSRPHDRQRAPVPGSALREGRGLRRRRIAGPCTVHGLGAGSTGHRHGQPSDDRLARSFSSKAGRAG